MRIGGSNINFKDYASTSSKLEKLPRKGKITARPTEDQLEHIRKEQEKEAKALKDNSLLVPIDWDYVKETINLSPEERELRAEQDRKEIYDRHDKEMAEIDAVYNRNMEKIEKLGEEEQKQIDAQNKAKASLIIANVSRGIMVSPMDLMFAKDISPEELQKALQKVEKDKKDTGYDLSHITKILSSVDFKI